MMNAAPTLYNLEKAIAVAAANNEAALDEPEADRWTFVVDDKGNGWAAVLVYDEDGELLGGVNL